MKMSVFVVLVLAAAAVMAAEVTTKQVKLESTSEIRSSLKSAKVIHIYEGLPHPTWEAKALTREKKRKDTTMIRGFPFYTPKVAAPADTAPSLRKILAEEESLAPFSGEKRCGGFHPDYAVAWSSDERELAVLICFGCGEVLFVEEEETYRYDVTVAALSRLETLLGRFRLKRPSDEAN